MDCVRLAHSRSLKPSSSDQTSRSPRQQRNSAGAESFARSDHGERYPRTSLLALNPSHERLGTLRFNAAHYPPPGWLPLIEAALGWGTCGATSKSHHARPLGWGKFSLVPPDPSRLPGRAWLLVSPWVFDYSGRSAALTSVTVGTLIALLAALRLASLHNSAGLSGINLLLAFWTAAAPWIYEYAINTGALWNNIFVGILVAVLAVWSAIATDADRRRRPGTSYSGTRGTGVA